MDAAEDLKDDREAVSVVADSAVVRRDYLLFNAIGSCIHLNRLSMFSAARKRIHMNSMHEVAPAKDIGGTKVIMPALDHRTGLQVLLLLLIVIHT